RRRRRRPPPARPRHTPRPQAPPRGPADTAVEDAIAAAVAAAAAEATATAAPAAPSAPAGPPMTAGEKDNLRRAIGSCWNLGTASTEAMNTTVTVLVAMVQDARPTSVTLMSSTGGSEAGTRSAFDAARRAILRCSSNGLPLPPEKYDQWREIVMDFNPQGMRMR
ncbi:MAG TPA: cell envelope integrity protein TolA, partial [Paracoccaceae bacterium]|nr:cell envelope integrity protein TolA [Paracoccaceae bacterium]